MTTPPPINPDVNDIADRAKYGYAVGTRLLATAQYRLAALAGSGRLDAEESIRLQHVLVDIWSALYSGTTCAVRDWDTDDDTWDDDDNTYSDGRTVMVQARIEKWEDSDSGWQHNRFLCPDGSVNEHPRGTICHISPRTPTDQWGVRNATADYVPSESELATDWGQRALSKAERLED